MFLTRFEESVDWLRHCDAEDLNEVDKLELAICKVGITHHKGFIYDSRYEPYLNAYGCYQLPHEFAEFLLAISKEHVRTVFDIGTCSGYTAALLGVFLSRFSDSVTVDSVDITRNTKHRQWIASVLRRNGITISFIEGTSADFNGKSYDLCFIDGSHQYEWVKNDYNNVGRHSRLCAFHDIRFCEGVIRFYNECKCGLRCQEFSESDTMFGIGLLWNGSVV